MYIPKHFEETSAEELHALIRNYPLATLIVNDGSGLVADHIPLLLKPSNTFPHGELVGHVARANGLWMTEGGTECLAIFHGPQHYISPNWYATKMQTGRVVPTWNYRVVHVQGRIHAVDDPEWIRQLVTELTDEFEAGQAVPWRVEDAPEDYIERLLEAVVGIRIEILGIIGKSKLSQNQSAENQESLVNGLQSHGDALSSEMAAAISRTAGDRD